MGGTITFDQKALQSVVWISLCLLHLGAEDQKAAQRRTQRSEAVHLNLRAGAEATPGLGLRIVSAFGDH